VLLDLLHLPRRYGVRDSKLGAGPTEHPELVLALRRFVVVAAIVLVVAGGLWMVGVEVADAEATRHMSPDVSATDATRAEQLARDFWDHPFQRSFYVAVTASDQADLEDCRFVQISAYAQFGYLADQGWVDCQGVSRDAPQ
jgi:hypothetical protein